MAIVPAMGTEKKDWKGTEGGWHNNTVGGPPGSLCISCSSANSIECLLLPSAMAIACKSAQTPLVRPWLHKGPDLFVKHQKSRTGNRALGSRITLHSQCSYHWERPSRIGGICGHVCFSLPPSLLFISSDVLSHTHRGLRLDP